MHMIAITNSEKITASCTKNPILLFTAFRTHTCNFSAPNAVAPTVPVTIRKIILYQIIFPCIRQIHKIILCKQTVKTDSTSAIFVNLKNCHAINVITMVKNHFTIPGVLRYIFLSFTSRSTITKKPLIPPHSR